MMMVSSCVVSEEKKRRVKGSGGRFIYLSMGETVWLLLSSREDPRP